MAQTKQSCFPKSNRGNIHVLVGAGGFIAVPSNPVTPVPVEVEQHGIELDMGMLLHTIPHLQQFCRPVGFALRSGLLDSPYHVIIRGAVTTLSYMDISYSLHWELWYKKL